MEHFPINPLTPVNVWIMRRDINLWNNTLCLYCTFLRAVKPAVVTLRTAGFIARHAPTRRVQATLARLHCRWSYAQYLVASSSLPSFTDLPLLTSTNPLLPSYTVLPSRSPRYRNDMCISAHITILWSKGLKRWYIWGSRSGVNKESSLLRCYTVSTGINSFPKYRQ